MEIISSDVGVFDLNLPIARFGSNYKCAVYAPSKFVPPKGPYVNVISKSIGAAYMRESIFRCENWLVFFIFVFYKVPEREKTILLWR